MGHRKNFRLDWMRSWEPNDLWTRQLQLAQQLTHDLVAFTLQRKKINCLSLVSTQRLHDDKLLASRPWVGC